MKTNELEKSIVRKCDDTCTVEDLMARIQGLTEEEKVELLEFINSRLGVAKES